MSIIACVGGGSNATGMFYPFIEDKAVRLIGVEAAGKGIDTDEHAATMTKGTEGVFQGSLQLSCCKMNTVRCCRPIRSQRVSIIRASDRSTRT